MQFAGELVVGLLEASTGNIEAWLAGAIALAGLILACAVYPATADGAVIYFRVRMLTTLGLNFTLRMDAFACSPCTRIRGAGNMRMHLQR